MKLMELYDRIENPTKQDNFHLNLLNMYCDHGDIYSPLTRTIDKPTRGYYNPNESDMYYAMLFNRWKNAIVNMTKSQYEYLCRMGIGGDNFIALRNYLKTVPDVKTKEEAFGILNKEYSDNRINIAMETHRWDNFGAYSGWEHVASRYFKIRQEKIPNVEHRLYLGIPGMQIHKFARIFVDKCYQRNQPFYFKFDDYAGRDDSFVIYCSTEYLMNFIDILNEIKREEPELVSKIDRPPMLTGNIDGWIGYGSEPELLPNGDNTSFNAKRAKLIESAAKKTMLSHSKKMLGYTFTYKGKKNVSYKYVISDLITDSMIKDKIKSYDYYLKNHTEAEAVKTYGFTRAQLTSSSCRYQIMKQVHDNVLPNINNVLNDEHTLNTTYITVDGNHFGALTDSSARSAVKKLFKFLVKSDPSIIEEFKKNLDSEFRNNHVDPDKICFDTHAVEMFRREDARTKFKPTEESKKKETPKKVASTMEEKVSALISKYNSKNRSFTQEDFEAIEYLKTNLPTNDEERVKMIKMIVWFNPGDTRTVEELERYKAHYADIDKRLRADYARLKKTGASVKEINAVVRKIRENKDLFVITAEKLMYARKKIKKK